MNTKFLLLIVCMLGLHTVQAQLTSSSLSGSVKDAQGQAIPGATVVAVHQPTGTRYGVLTSADGRFLITNALPGGPYSITTSFIGLKTDVRSDIQLTLGEDTRLTIVLADDARQLQNIVIKGEREGTKVGAGVSVSEAAIRRMPTLSRSITDMTRLTPQSSNNSFAGTNFRYNNVTIDGTINNDAIGFSPSLGGVTGSSGMPGSSTRNNPISLDAIQDIQVYIAPFDVKVGNFLGGSINAVTRSGTNDITGSVYAFGRNASLVNTYNPSADSKAKLSNSYHDYQLGFRVGLPLIKNKLFWFTNEEITNRQEPVQFQAGTSGSLIKDITVAQEIASFLKTNYSFDVGSYGDYNIYSKSTKFFNRIDWNINDKHQLAVRNNTVISEATNLERDALNFRFGSMDYKQNNVQSSTVAELKSRLTNRLSNNLVVGFTSIHDYRNPLSGNVDFPQVEIAYNGGTILLGNDREATVFNLRQKTFEITDNLTWYKGKHTFTAGTHNELYHIQYGFVNSWNGRVAYSSLTDFYNKLPNRVRGSYAFSDSENNRDYLFNNPYATFNVNLLSVYFQDEIRVNDRLKITPGLRFDYTGLPKKPALNSQVNTTDEGTTYGTTYTHTLFKNLTNTYFNNVQISPRFGFNYDINGDKSIVIRGGSGVFTGRIPFAWLGYAFYNDGVGFGAYDYNNIASTAAASRPVGDPLTGAAAYNAQNTQTQTTQVDLVDNNFKMPQMWRSNLAVDYTIDGYKFTVEGLYTKVIHDLKFQQINLKDQVRYYSYDTEQQQPIYVSSTGTASAQKINSSFSNAYLLSNTSKGYRYSLTFQLQKTYTSGFGFSAAYTYGKSYDISNGIRNSMESNWQLNQSLTPNDPKLAYSNFDVRSRIVGTLNYRYQWNETNNTTVSLFYSFQSGSPFTWGYINTNIAGTPQAAGLAYIPKDLTEAQTLLPTGTQAQDFMNYVNGIDYLASRKGNFTERNGGRTPWNNSMDLRILHEIKIGGRKSLQLSWDVINVLNLVNKKLGWYYFSPNTYNSTASVGLTRATNPATGDPTFTWSNPGTPYSVDPLSSRWQMQMGARFNF
ncbi:MAG: carboxypeptidase regulatory-like domain-containing protein [Siphonobacter sp.]